MKNLGILLIGILLGALATLAYMKNQVPVQELVQEPIQTPVLAQTETASPEEKLAKQILTSNKEVPAINRVTEVRATAADQENTIQTAKDQKLDGSNGKKNGALNDEEFNQELMDLLARQHELTEEEERLGSAALEELLANQPAELAPIFESDLNPKKNSLLKGQISAKYKKHLSQEKDINWAYEAEAFLMAHFSNQQDSKFTPLRIDCRSSSCEISGLIYLDTEHDENSPDSMYLIIQELVQITTAVRDNSGYNRYFEGMGGDFGLEPELLKLRPMPHYIFLKRAKSSY